MINKAAKWVMERKARGDSDEKAGLPRLFRTICANGGASLEEIHRLLNTDDVTNALELVEPASWTLKEKPPTTESDDIGFVIEPRNRDHPDSMLPA